MCRRREKKRSKANKCSKDVCAKDEGTGNREVSAYVCVCVNNRSDGWTDGEDNDVGESSGR